MAKRDQKPVNRVARRNRYKYYRKRGVYLRIGFIYLRMGPRGQLLWTLRKVKWS
jgi:hypothetical protein